MQKQRRSCLFNVSDCVTFLRAYFLWTPVRLILNLKKLTLWRLRVINSQWKHSNALRWRVAVELHVTVNYTVQQISNDEWKTNFMSLAILFHLLCAQHVSDINISIFRSLRLCWWVTTSVVLFSVRCVLEFLLQLIFGGVRFAGWSKTNTTKYQLQQKLQHTTNWEQDDRCGNSSTQSQAPEDEYINVRNMLSA